MVLSVCSDDSMQLMTMRSLAHANVMSREWFACMSLFMRWCCEQGFLGWVVSIGLC